MDFLGNRLVSFPLDDSPLAGPRGLTGRALSSRVCDGLFSSLFGLLGIWTIIIHAALLGGLSLRNLVNCLSASALVVLGAFGIRYWSKRKEDQRCGLVERDFTTVGMLTILLLICGAASLFAIKPSGDDVGYVSRIVYFLDNVDYNLDLTTYDYALLDEKFERPFVVFDAIGFVWAYLCLLFDVAFVDLYYLFIPFFWGVLLPMAWYLVFSKIAKSSASAVLAATGVCVFLSVLGLTNKQFGHVAFLRIWQGKSVVMSVVVPIFIAFSLDFFRKPGFKNWLKSCSVLVTTTGLSATSLFLFPFVGLSLGAGYLCSRVPVVHLKDLKKCLFYYGCFWYLVLAGIFAMNNICREGVSVSNLYFPTTFFGQYRLVFGDFPGPASMALSLAVLAGFILVDRDSRKFLLGWVLFAVAFGLNPFVFPHVSSLVTTNNAYWRLFYALPFPFLVGIPIIFVMDAMYGSFGRRGTAGRHRNHRAVATIRGKARYVGVAVFCSMVIAGVAVNAVPNRYAVFQKADFGFFRHKIGYQLEQSVKDIIRHSPSGPMLAPFEYSSKIPLFSSRHPQVAVHFHLLMGYGVMYNELEEARSKLRAVAYISNPESKYMRYLRNLEDVFGTYKLKGPDDLRALLDRGLKTVVLDALMETLEKAQGELMKKGFRIAYGNDSFLIYVR